MAPRSDTFRQQSGTLMGTVAKTIVIVVAALLVVLVVLALVLEWNDLRGPLANRISAELGREVVIAGDLEVDLGLAPRIRAHDVRVANAPWAEQPMFETRRIAFTLPLGRLLFGRTLLRDLVVDAPIARLERNAQGQANWDFLEDDPDDEPLPVDGLTVTDGRFVFRDATAAAELSGSLHAEAGRSRIEAEGSYRDAPFALHIDGGDLSELARGDPYPITATLSSGDNQVRAEGQLSDPGVEVNLDVLLSAAGPDLGALLSAAGLPAPKMDRYEIAGRLTRDGPHWSYRDLSGFLGATRLENGAVAVDGEREPLLVRGDLQFAQFDFDELMEFFGLGETPEAREPRERVFPDNPVELEWLGALEVDARLRSREARLWHLAGDEMEVRLALQDSRLSLGPARVGVADGELRLELVVAGDEPTPAFELDVGLSEVALTRLLAPTEAVEFIAGRLSGRIQLNGAGASIADAMGASHGRLGLVLTEGTIDHTLAEGIALNLLELLFGDGDEEQRIRCGAAAMDIDAGIMAPELLLLDTEQRLIVGNGSIDLGNETLALELEAHAKEGASLSLQAPVEVEGSFLDPSVGPEAGEIAARAVVGAALAALAAPLAAVLPFIEAGTVDDHECVALFRETEERFAQQGEPEPAVPNGE